MLDGGHETYKHFVGEWRSDYRALVRTLRFILPHFLLFLFSILFITSTVLTVLWLGYGLRQLIDQGFSSYEHLKNSVLILGGFVTALAASGYGRLYFASFLAEKASLSLRKALLEKLLWMDAGFFEKNMVGDLLSTLIHDVWLIQTLISQTIPAMIRNLMIATGGAVFLFYSNSKLAFIMCCIFPVVFLPLLIFGDWTHRTRKKRKSHIASASALIEEALTGIKVVQAFNREHLEEEKILKELKKGVLSAKRHIRLRSLVAFIIIFLGFGVIALILWVGGTDVLNHKMTTGQLTSFIYYSLAVVGSLGTLGEMWGDIHRASNASSRIESVLNATSSLERSPRLSAATSPAPLHVVPKGSFISFKNVSFFYPSSQETAVLKNVSFEIPPGAKVAIVGPSGAGKTTIFELLMRFYDPQEGQIYLSGENIEYMNIKSLRECTGLVSQESLLFSGSIYDNISFGLEEKTKAQVLEAARVAMVTEFTDHLPKKLNTPVGPRGMALSGGQRQRIAIARALLKNAPILLLDEATSSLDIYQESLIQKALDHLMKNRTTLTIAHRLTTVVKADLIIVLHQGTISAIGKHAELLRKSSLYQKLAQLQFLETDPI